MTRTIEIAANYYNTQQEAESAAWAKSCFDEFFHCVYRNNNGMYIEDTIGIVFSDEQLICTYYKGEKQ
jgi:hypothetical protein